MNDPLSIPDNRPDENVAPWQRLLNRQERFLGDVALYLENRRYSRVRIVAVHLDETRFAVDVALLTTRGLYNERPPSWTMGGVRTGWTFSDDLQEWSLRHIGSLFFEPALVDAVVRQGERAEDDAYDRAAVGRWIRAYKIALLTPHLDGELGLFWRSRRVGRVIDNRMMQRRWFVGAYPWIQGTFTPEDLDPDLMRNLAAYADAFAHPDRDTVPIPQRLYAGWGLKTTKQALIRLLVPIINVKEGTIQCRVEGVNVLPNWVEQCFEGGHPRTVEEIQRMADAYKYGSITADEFAVWFVKILHALSPGTDLRPLMALVPGDLPAALHARLTAAVDEQADDDYRCC